MLYLPCNPISRQSDFRVRGCKKEKTTLPKAPTCVTEFSYVAIQYPRPSWGILTPFPFENRESRIKAPRTTRLVRRAFVQGVHEKANTSARAHSLQVRKRVCTSSPKAKKRVCTRKPTFPFKRIRLGEETCMHEKANTSVKARSLGRGNVYARESHHFNSNAFPPGGETCIHEFA